MIAILWLMAVGMLFMSIAIVGLVQRCERQEDNIQRLTDELRNPAVTGATHKLKGIDQ